MNKELLNRIEQKLEEVETTIFERADSNNYPTCDFDFILEPESLETEELSFWEWNDRENHSWDLGYRSALLFVKEHIANKDKSLKDKAISSMNAIEEINEFLMVELNIFNSGYNLEKVEQVDMNQFEATFIFGDTFKSRKIITFVNESNELKIKFNDELRELKARWFWIALVSD